ncbi:hypothetical protein [Methylophilus luteus]|uniref:Uncharacterized protein n=1 Tax=Methylophilus luteus TaxID=640108 RepID=A0ABW3F8X8_9PROT
MQQDLTPDSLHSVLNDVVNECMPDMQSGPVSQLIRHFTSANSLASSPPPEWRRIKKSRQKPFIFAFQHLGSDQVIVAYQNLLGEIIFIDPAGF